MIKYIVFLFICFFSLISWSKDISWYDLELRNNLYYDKNKNIPFTGEIKSKKNGKIIKGMKELSLIHISEPTRPERIGFAGGFV